MVELIEAGEELSRGVAELLIERGKLDATGFERALRLQDETGERVDLLLTKLGQVSERDMADALSTRLKLPLAEARDYPSVALLDDRLSVKFLKEYRMLPISDTPDGIVLAMADPLDNYAINAVKLIANKPVLPRGRRPSRNRSSIRAPLCERRKRCRWVSRRFICNGGRGYSKRCRASA